MRSLVNAPHAIPALLLFGSIGPLAFALFTQYVWHLPPCHYCILQRYPYALPLLAGLLAVLPALRVHRGKLLLLGVLGWLGTMGIALFHVGIEQGLIVMEGGCSTATLSGSIDDIRAQIMGAPLVACNAVSAQFLGLSMAAWNAICALGLCLIALYLWRNRMEPTQ